MASFLIASAATEIYTLSLHDALPISRRRLDDRAARPQRPRGFCGLDHAHGDAVLHRAARVEVFDLREQDRKSTRLNSSHVAISYAVFCLKKKKPHSRKPLLKTNPTNL